MFEVCNMLKFACQAFSVPCKTLYRWGYNKSFHERYRSHDTSRTFRTTVIATKCSEVCVGDIHTNVE